MEEFWDHTDEGPLGQLPLYDKLQREEPVFVLGRMKAVEEVSRRGPVRFIVPVFLDIPPGPLEEFRQEVVARGFQVLRVLWDASEDDGGVGKGGFGFAAARRPAPAPWVRRPLKR